MRATVAISVILLPPREESDRPGGGDVQRLGFDLNRRTHVVRDSLGQAAPLGPEEEDGGAAELQLLERPTVVRDKRDGSSATGVERHAPDRPGARAQRL